MTTPKQKRKARVIYILERPEIWQDGINHPVLYGCYKNKASAFRSKKYADKENKQFHGSIKYGKINVIKFKEAL